MENNLNYSMISIGFPSVLITSNIVLVKKKTWDLRESSLSSYLSIYSKEEVKRAKLISSINNTNTYELESSGTDLYDLILFVKDDFNLNITEFEPSYYTCIGAVEIPQIGIQREETSEKVIIDFTLGETFLSKDTGAAEIVNIEFISSNYTSDKLGKRGASSLTKMEEYFPKVEKPVTRSLDSKSISYVPNGVMYKNKIFFKQDLGLDFSSFGDIKSYQSISHKGNEYIRLENTNGDIVLRNVTFSNTGAVTLITSEYNVVVESSSIYTHLVNPDYIVRVNPVNLQSTYIKTDYYSSNSLTSVPEIDSVDHGDEVESTRSLVEWGTDISDFNVSTIYSLPTSEDWFLQSKYLKFIKSVVTQDIYDYAMECHNGSIFIIKRYFKGSSKVMDYLAIDYEGRKKVITKEYLLDIDGILIVKLDNGSHVAYKGDLSQELYLESTYDLYTLFPSGTEMIWNTQNLDLSKILLIRDRFQEINI
jgi:hypothetical protein